MENFFSTVIIYPLTQIIEVSYVFFNRFFKNPGISVIGVSLAVTLLCLPLYIVAERWQQIQRNTEAKLKPRTDKIKQAFKGDEQYMMLNTYYRQNHYHPLMALRSSFGLLIQIPFFIAAYSFLSNMEALKGQSFLFIKDMGAPDRLFAIGSFYVNILPVAMTAINIIAGAIYTKGFAVKEKVQIYGMALVFLVLLYNSPSGLVLYWTMNNIFSLIKNIFYKLKNPLKVLYGILCAVVIAMDIYLIFFFNKSRRIVYLRIAAVICFTSLLFIPFIVKAFNHLADKILKSVADDKKLRFGIFIFASVGCCLLTGLVLPSLLVSSSVQEFADIADYGCPNFFVWNTFFQCAGLFIFWPVCIYFLFHKKIQTLMTLFLSCFLVCALLNAFAFAGDYGTMNQWLVFIGGVRFDKAGVLLLNIVTIFILVAAVILLMRFFPKFLSSILLVACLGFFTFGIVNVNSINRKYTDYKNNISLQNTSSTLKPEFHLSKTGKNVIVIMIDRAMSAFVESVFEESPELYNNYDGFTFYKNCASFHGHTIFGAPSLFGGYEYTPWEREKRNDKTLKEQHNESLLLMPRVFTEQADFSATIADSSWADWSWIPNMHIADDYPKIEGKNLNTKYNFEFEKRHPDLKSNPNLLAKVLKRDFFWVSLFREAPMVLRPFIFYDETWWNSENVEKISPFPSQYAELYFLPEITDFNSKSENNFIYFVNELTHDACKLEAPDYVPVKNVTSSGKGKFADDAYYDVNAAALLRIGKWLKYLQTENCYNNTRIIIVSDHGGGSAVDKAEFEDFDNPVLDVPGRKDHLKDHYHPVLLVKDFNSHGKLKTDMNFMTNADVPLLAFKDIIKNPVNPFTGNPVTDKIKHRDGAVILTPFIWNADQLIDMYSIPAKENEWYTVKDNIFESKNWVQGIPESAK